MAKNNSKKRKLHSNHAENRKPAQPIRRKDAVKRQKPSSKPAKKKEQQQHPTIPFIPESDRILLIGEGDFSFSKSIVEEHGCCDITATSYDAQEVLFEKYKPQVEEHISYLEDEAQTVLYNVDATKLDKNKALLKAERFDVVIFNFPHVGGKSTDVNRQVRCNQELLVAFFKTSQTLLAHEGKVVVTLFEGEPYTLWNIRDLARHAGLEVVRSFKFKAEAYPGYSHARTLGNIEGGGGWKGEDRESRSYVFGMKGGGTQKDEGAAGNGKGKTQKEMQQEMEKQRRIRMGETQKGDEAKKRKRDEDTSSDEED